MPNRIKLRRSYTAGAVPTLSDLEANEVAVNYADGKLYVRTPSNTIQSITLGGSGGGTSNNADTLLRSFFLPPAPTNLTATAGNAQVALTWTAPTVLAQTPITDYVVEYSSNGGTTWTNADTPVISISSQPTNQTAASGAATFSVTASVTQSATLSYQWQKQESGAGSFANVAGATSASLSLSGLTNAADNGDVYRVVVSATGGATSVTSSTATLTVAPAGDPLWSSVGLLVPFDTNTTDVKANLAATVQGSSPTITAGGKFGSYAAWSSDNSGLLYSVTAPGTSDFTIECWLRRGATTWGSSGTRVLSLGSNSVYIRLLSEAGSQLYAIWGNEPLEEQQDIQSGFTPTGGAWHHMAIVRQSSRFRFYWNGVQTGNSLPNVTMNLTGSLTLGAEGVAAWGTWMDDFRYTLACRYPDGTTFTPPAAAFPTN